MNILFFVLLPPFAPDLVSERSNNTVLCLLKVQYVYDVTSDVV